MLGYLAQYAWTEIAWIATAVFLMGVFHRALVIYAIFIIFLFLVYSPRPISRLGNIKKLHLIAVGLIPCYLLGLVLISTTNPIAFVYAQELMDSSIFNSINSFRNNSLAYLGRTSYVALLDDSSIFMMFYSFLKLYSYYLFMPFPWEIQNAMDFYAFWEVLIRITLIFFSCSSGEKLLV